ncbi:hypothetical protein C8R43DRAFT_959957 [Mycena crocata]|nr:hypothetical protein C8R43DRAFT_959957 [Mycena crocata]
MQFISVIYVSAALFLASSAAPLPVQNGVASLNARIPSDVFTEVDLTLRAPQDDTLSGGSDTSTPVIAECQMKTQLPLAQELLFDQSAGALFMGAIVCANDCKIPQGAIGEAKCPQNGEILDRSFLPSSFIFAVYVPGPNPFYAPQQTFYYPQNLLPPPLPQIPAQMPAYFHPQPYFYPPHAQMVAPVQAFGRKDRIVLDRLRTGYRDSTVQEWLDPEGQSEKGFLIQICYCAPLFYSPGDQYKPVNRCRSADCANFEYLCAFPTLVQGLAVEYDAMLVMKVKYKESKRGGAKAVQSVNTPMPNTDPPLFDSRVLSAHKTLDGIRAYEWSTTWKAPKKK